MAKLHASFEDTNTGARAAAMGGAFTAIADDVYAVYYNPAGLYQLGRKEFSASYGLLNAGLKDQTKIGSSYLVYAQPFSQKIGTFGLSWQQLYASNLYQEQAIALGYGRRISGSVSLGITIKHLSRKFSVPEGSTNDSGFTNLSKTDPAFKDGNSKSNIGLDFGLLWQLGKKYSLGVMVQDINEPDMAIASQSQDKVPMILRSGLAWQDRSLILSGQINSGPSAGRSSRDTFFIASIEKWWLSSKLMNADLALRGSFSAGPQSFNQTSLGISYRLGNAQLDYGFFIPLKDLGLGSTQGNHQFSLTFRFGKAILNTEIKTRRRSIESLIRKAEQQIEYYRQETQKTVLELAQLQDRGSQRTLDISHRRIEKGEAAAVHYISDQYEEELNHYWLRKKAGSTVEEQVKILTKIIEEFAGLKVAPVAVNFAEAVNSTETELESAKTELESAKSIRAKAEVKLSADWTTYLKLAAKEISSQDRVEILAKIADEYAATGLNLSYVYEELQVVKHQK